MSRDTNPQKTYNSLGGAQQADRAIKKTRNVLSRSFSVVLHMKKEESKQPKREDTKKVVTFLIVPGEVKVAQTNWFQREKQILTISYASAPNSALKNFEKWRKSNQKHHI